MLSPDASVRDIHQAYETLRMSYLPVKRDRSIPLSPEVTEQLQKLDRAFRGALDTQNSINHTQKKANSSPSAKTTPQTRTSKKNSLQSVVQTQSKTSSQYQPSEPAHSRARLDHSAAKRTLKEKYEAWLAKKNNTAPSHSIALDDLVSPQQRSQSLGGLTPSFASRVIASARGMATRITIALVFSHHILEKFSKLHFAVWALLGCALALVIGGNWVTGIIFGILAKYLLRPLLKYPRWSLGLGLFCLFAAYFS